MKRIVVALLLLVSSDVARAEFNVVEASIADMQQAMASGRVTSRDLVQQYLMRIALYDKKLNAVITVNPNVLREAEERDRERSQGRADRPIARHSDRDQGQHPHHQHADHRRYARLRGLRTAL